MLKSLVNNQVSHKMVPLMPLIWIEFNTVNFTLVSWQIVHNGLAKFFLASSGDVSAVEIAYIFNRAAFNEDQLSL